MNFPEEYRVYNIGKYRQRWLRPDEVAIQPDGEVVYNNPDSEDDERWYTNDAIVIKVSRFTGKRDVNGKKIFSGDIIQGCDDTGLVVVEWNSILAGWCATRGHVRIDVSQWGNREVVGNIYENPELLKMEIEISD